MEIKIRSVCDCKDVIIKEDNICLELGLLTEKESKELARDLLNAAEELLR